MKKLMIGIVIVLSLFTGTAQALDPLYIMLSMPGWNQMISGQEYWTTPKHVRNWSIEIWEGVYTSYPDLHYHYVFRTALYQESSATHYEFLDRRDPPLPGGTSDIALILFKSYGVPMEFSETAPTPQGFFELNEFGWGTWFSTIGSPPIGSTWSLWRAFHNKERPDEMYLQCVASGTGLTQQDLPNVVLYEGWGQAP